MAIDLCSSVGGNTGGINCGVKRRRPIKPIVGSKEFTPSDYGTKASLAAAMIAACKQDNGTSGKLYPFPDILEVEDLTTEDTFGNLAFGPQKRLNKGVPSYRYSCEVGQEQFQQLLAFDGATLPVFTMDNASNVWGELDNATKNWKGEQALISISGNGFENGTEASSGVCLITISYISADNFNKRSAFASLPDLASGDLKGLIDIVPTLFAAPVSNAYKIKFSIKANIVGGDDLNVYDDFGTELAALTWTAKSGTTYATDLGITSTVVDATNKVITFTFDTTDYTAVTAGSNFKVIAPNIAALEAGGIVGYEIEDIILTKPV